MAQILFYAMAVVALGSAVAMVTRKSPVASLLYMVTTLASLAVIFVLFEAHFLAAIQVIVYAGAIMVLFLFVIMLLGAERLPDSKPLPWQRPLAVILGVLLAVEAVLVLFKGQLGAMPAGDLPADFGAPRLVGETLFGPYLLPFEVISVLLLAAMVGVVVLNRRNRRTG